MRHSPDSSVPECGGVTLPIEAGKENVVLELVQKWGADALRNSDGTTFSEDLARLNFPIYSTICLVRADQRYIRQHLDKLPQHFLMSKAVAATANHLTIDLLDGYFADKYTIDCRHNAKQFWEATRDDSL